jgi:PAS domain S-box-containing protein
MEIQVKPPEEVISEVTLLRQQIAALQAEVQRLKQTPPHLLADAARPAPAELVWGQMGPDYKRLLEAVTDYIYSVKVERGRAVATLHGSACVKVTGYTPQEYLDDPHLWHRMIYEEDRPLVLDQIAKALAGEAASPVEHRIVHKSGAVRWVRNTPVLRYNRSGRFVGYDGLIADITDSKRMEAALRESESKFRSLAEMTAAAIFICRDTQLCYVNPAAEVISGYTSTELLSMNFLDIIHPDFRARAFQWVEARLRGEPVPTRYEIKIITKSGQVRWVDFVGGLIQFQGEPAILGTTFDITEHKHNEAEIIRRNSELMTLQYAGATIASSLDLDFVLNTFTAELVNLLGIEGCAIFAWEQSTNQMSLLAQTSLAQEVREEVMVKQYLLDDFPVRKQVFQERRTQQLALSQAELYPPERTYMQAAKVQTLLILPMESQGHGVGLVEVVANHDQRVFTHEEIALTQLLANQAASAIQNARLYEQAQREISERIQKEVALRRSEAKNRALLDAIPDIMFRMSRDGIYLDYHPGKNGDSTFLTGECIGKNVNQVLPAEIAALTLEHVAKALDSGIGQVFEYRLPQLYGQNDYETRLVVSGPDEVLGIVRDITERKRMVEQAIQAERLAALGRLSTVLTHEINNPLQSMRTHLDLLLDFQLEPGEDKKFLQVLHREVERLNDITRRILNFARPHPASRRKVYVTDLMEEVLVLAGKQLQQNSIKVTTDFREVSPVLAAPDQLLQVFLNIILNSFEALPLNGQLHIAIYQDDGQVTISFMNNGPIIPPDIMPHIFEPFFTTKPEGSGLGLWVSHNLIEQHAGALTAENLGSAQGVAFTINLPLAKTVEINNDRFSAIN